MLITTSICPNKSYPGRFADNPRQNRGLILPLSLSSPTQVYIHFLLARMEPPYLFHSLLPFYLYQGIWGHKVAAISVHRQYLLSFLSLPLLAVFLPLGPLFSKLCPFLSSPSYVSFLLFSLLISYYWILQTPPYLWLFSASFLFPTPPPPILLAT